MANDTRTIERRARQQGFTVEKRQSGHVKFQAPGGGVAFTGSTPSAQSSNLNHLERLRKLGYQDKPRRDDPVAIAAVKQKLRAGEVYALVLERLAKVGRETSADLADALGFSLPAINKALNHLRETIPNLTKVGAYWVWTSGQGPVLLEDTDPDDTEEVERTVSFVEALKDFLRRTTGEHHYTEIARKLSLPAEEVEKVLKKLHTDGEILSPHLNFYGVEVQPSRMFVRLPARSPSREIVKYLFEHRGPQQKSEVARALGLDEKNVQAALSYLGRTEWPVSRAGRGYWYYAHDVKPEAANGVVASNGHKPEQPQEAQSEPEDNDAPQRELRLSIIGSSGQGMLCRSGESFYLVTPFTMPG